MTTIRRKGLILGSAVLAVVVAAGVILGGRSSRGAPRADEARALMGAWMEAPRLTAELMMERYGPPDRVSAAAVTWIDRGPWKRVTVYGQNPVDFLEQVVRYHVPAMAAIPLADFGSGTALKFTNDELSAASGQESLNILALNLADEIAVGKRTAEQASRFYLRTATIAAAGKSSPYLQGLLFKPETAVRTPAIGY